MHSSRRRGRLGVVEEPGAYRMTHYRYQNVPMDGPGFIPTFQRKMEPLGRFYRPCETPLMIGMQNIMRVGLNFREPKME